MRAPWHLATSSLAGRKGRSALLVAAVALASALTVAVSVGIDTLAASVTLTTGQMVGLADARVRHRFGGKLEASLLQEIRAWPQTRYAAASVEVGVSLTLPRTGKTVTLVAHGVEPELYAKLYPTRLQSGDMLALPGDCVIDQQAAARLDAVVGDTLRVIRFGEPIELRVVGVLDRPPLEVLQRRVVMVALPMAQKIAGYTDRFDQIDVQLVDRAALGEDLPELPPTAMFQTVASASTGLNRAMRSARLAMLMVAALVYLASSLIILTSLTTAVTQRMRELAILRCIGTSRGQLAASQILAGAMLALLGALAGAPLGLAAGYAMYWHKAHALPAGLVVQPATLLFTFAAATGAGVLGSLYPALLAAGASPLKVLASRARPARWPGISICTVAGVLLVAVQPTILMTQRDDQLAAWATLFAGVPSLFVGFFLLSVPVLLLIAQGLAPLLAMLLRIPASLLRQTLLATPYRHAFTGGALSVGLAVLVVIWTVGRSATGSYFANVKMPDAFVHSFGGLSEQQLLELKKAPVITKIVATTMFPVDARENRFGLAGFAPDLTQFVASDIEPFVNMTDLTWVQGDPRQAILEMQKGRAVLVSKEYLIAHGVGLGKSVTLDTPLRGEVEFRVVGVVSSPGLDMAVHFFGIQRAYADAAISCVFGTRQDAASYFGVDQTHLVLLQLDESVDDTTALQQVRSAAPGTVAGLSRHILRMVRVVTDDFMALASSVALAALLIACAGVGNLIVANIAARRFEFGVLRAVGGSQGLLGRLILAETLVLAAVGCVIGTGLGMALAFVTQQLHRRMVGLTYTPELPWDIAGYGWLAVALGALIAAAAPIVKLMRTHPRGLLAG